MKHSSFRHRVVQFLVLSTTHLDIRVCHTTDPSSQCCRRRRCCRCDRAVNTPRCIRWSSNLRHTRSCYYLEAACHHEDTVAHTRDQSSHRNTHIRVSPTLRYSSHDCYSLVLRSSRQSHSLFPTSRRHSYIPLSHCRNHLANVNKCHT